MTKEPIMIDDIDVSECEFYWQEEGLCNNGNLSSNCQENKDCIYKRYIRKEQECEELRGGQRDLNKVIKELKEQCDQLQARLDDVLIVNYEAIAERYKQALQEIKDFFEYEFYGENIWVKQTILQKISEVIDEN